MSSKEKVSFEMDKEYIDTLKEIITIKEQDIQSQEGTNQAQDTKESVLDEFERMIEDPKIVAYYDPATGRGYDVYAEKPISQMIGFKDGKPEFIYMTKDEYYQTKEAK